MIYVKINGIEYEAEISGNLNDSDWNYRESKSIKTNQMNIADALFNFIDDVQWFIVEYIEKVTVIEGQAEPKKEIIRVEHDNSDYCVAGAVTDLRNGYITIKMGKPTDLERAYEELYG